MLRNRSNSKAAWTAGRLAARRLLRRTESDRDTELGGLLASQLDEMKGLAMKLGQIVSYMDVPLPDSVQEQLAQLQTGAVGLSEEETQEALAAALGPGFHSRFERLDFNPVAAASIGQVHRAQAGGRDIALKVQYPNVAESFVDDLATVKRLASLASLASSVDGRAIVRELAERLAEECDYLREAKFQQQFREAFRDDANVHVPAVVAWATTERTLATAWAEGVRFSEASNASVERRQSFATTLVRFSYRSLLVLAAVQADPHPGNFLFGPGYRVSFLDFGCVRVLDGEFVASLRGMIQAIDQRDRPAFREHVIELGMAPKPRRFDFDHHFSAMDHLHHPLLRPRFELTADYLREGLAFNGPQSPNARQMAMPPAYIWVARLQWGLWSLLKRLRVPVALRDTLDAILAEPITPLIQLEVSCPEHSPNKSGLACSTDSTP